MADGEMDFVKAMEYPTIKARELTWAHRGVLVCIQTEVALYYGHITSVIFHSFGQVAVGLTTLTGIETDVRMEHDHPVHVTEVRMQTKGIDPTSVVGL